MRCRMYRICTERCEQNHAMNFMVRHGSARFASRAQLGCFFPGSLPTSSSGLPGKDSTCRLGTSKLAKHSQISHISNKSEALVIGLRMFETLFDSRPFWTFLVVCPGYINGNVAASNASLTSESTWITWKAQASSKQTDQSWILLFASC